MLLDNRSPAIKAICAPTAMVGTISKVSPRFSTSAPLKNRLSSRFGFPSSAFDRGYAAGEKGDDQTAIADYSEAIRLVPDYADAFRGRGLLYDALVKKS
jgi:tetratricopeptide repeat protein